MNGQTSAHRVRQIAFADQPGCLPRAIVTCQFPHPAIRRADFVMQ
jgi:hypothetical protein